MINVDDIPNVISWLQKKGAGDIMIILISVLAVWILAWRIFIKQWLIKKSEEKGKWSWMDEVLDIGPLALFGFALMSIVIGSLVVQAVILIVYVPKLIPACAVFLAAIIIPLVFLIKHMK